MGIVITPKFIKNYLNLAKIYKIPAFVPKVNKEQLIELGFGQFAEFYLNQINELVKEDFPLIDHFLSGSLEFIDDKVQFYIDIFTSLKPGLKHLLFHPAKMSPELQALRHTPVECNQDYEAFTSKKLKEHTDSLNIHLIGYKDIRKYFRELI